MSAIAALLVLPPLGQRMIVTSDEARFALVARDMIDRGVWFGAYVREKQYRNKPPLYPWAIAALAWARGGVTEATAQAPVAIAALGATLFTFLLGDRLFNRRAGLWGALALVTGYGFFTGSQELLPDMLVTCFAAAAAYAFWRAVAEPPGQTALVAFHAALAFGVFAKGPAGLVPLLVAAVWLATDGGLAGVRRLWSPLGAAVFAVITLAWLGPFLALGAQSFGTKVLWSDWVAWFVGVPDPADAANSVLDWLKGLMPWTLLLLLALVGAGRAWREPPVRFALLLLAVPLVLILLSANQRERYLLLTFPGAALLVGWWADAHGGRPTALTRAVAWAGPVLAVGGVILLLAPPAESLRPPFAPHDWSVAPLVVGTGILGAALFHGLRAGRPRALVYGLTVATVLLLVPGTRLHNEWSNRTQNFQALAAAVERHARGGETRVFGGRFFPIDFYLGRPLLRIWTVEEFNEYVARPERPVVVVNGRTWGLVQGSISPEVGVLEQLRVRGQDMLIVRRRSEPAAGTVRLALR